MAINDIVQTIAEARVDARSLSEFLFKPADFMVNRRLSPPINTLNFYIDRISSVNASVIAVQQSVAAADALIDNNATQAADAVNSAIEGVAIDANLITDALIKTVPSMGEPASNQQTVNNGFRAKIKPIPTYKDDAVFPTTFAPNQDFRGKGRRSLTLAVPSDKSGFIFHPTSTARNSVSGIHLFSDAQTKTAGTVAIDTSDSSFAIIDDVRITGFDIGIVDNNTPNTSSFSARNSYREFEVNNCNVGVKAYGANANSYSFGRVYNCNTGYDFNDAESITLIGMNIESCNLSIKTKDSAFINLFGGYLESGVGNKNFELDTSTSISAYGVKVNGTRGFDECFDPNKSEWHFDAKDTSGSKARLSFIPAASRQYMRNSDFSLGFSDWSITGATHSFVADKESGSQAVLINPTSSADYIQQAFKVEGDVKTVSLGVRFKPKSAGVFRINILQSSVVIAQYSYRSMEESLEFLTATITANIADPTKSITVRIYPDVEVGTGAVIIDQAWAVRGYFVSAPRRYENATVLLTAPKTLISKTVSANATDIVALTDTPTLCLGVRVRLSISGTAATTNNTILRINGTDAELWAVKDTQKAVAEFTLPLSANLDIRAMVGSASNSVTYKVEVIEFII